MNNLDDKLDDLQEQKYLLYGDFFEHVIMQVVALALSTVAIESQNQESLKLILFSGIIGFLAEIKIVYDMKQIQKEVERVLLWRDKKTY